MKNLILLLAILSSTFLIWSCEKEDATPQDDLIDSLREGVFISCEGAFGQGNAVVYFLDDRKSQIIPEVYNFVNQKLVGDVLHSMEFEDDKVYLVVNNSGKIIQVTRETFLETGVIEGLTAPTEMEVEDGKGYIGSLYSRHILVADINTLSVTDSIFLGEQSNQIFEEDNRLWVLSQSEYQGRVKDHIYYVNLSDRSVDSVKVGSNPTNWALGDDEQLYVYCRGAESSDDPAIYSIGISSQSMEHKTELDVPSDFYGRVAFDDAGDRLLIHLPGGVYTSQRGSGQLSGTPLIDLSQIQNLYGLDVDPDNGDIFIGDARDFSTSGTVNVFTSDGQPKGGFAAGIGPNHFYFE